MRAELEDMRSLNELSTLLMREENKSETCYDEITRTAIAISGADKGNLQLFDETLGFTQDRCPTRLPRTVLEVLWERERSCRLLMWHCNGYKRPSHC